MWISDIRETNRFFPDLEILVFITTLPLSVVCKVPRTAPSADWEIKMATAMREAKNLLRREMKQRLTALSSEEKARQSEIVLKKVIICYNLQ